MSDPRNAAPDAVWRLQQQAAESAPGRSEAAREFPAISHGSRLEPTSVAFKDELRDTERPAPLYRWVAEVWGYAAVLAAILIGVSRLLSGSFGLVPMVAYVCVAGGLVGTVLALLRSVQERKNGGNSPVHYERRIIL